MFLLPAGPWPCSVDQLRQQLIDGLRPLLDVKERLTVLGQWPALSHLALDLSEARIDPARPLPKPKAAVHRQPGPACSELRILATPLRIGDSASAYVDLRAAELQLEFMLDEAGHHWLIPVKAGQGAVQVRMAKSELDRLFAETARRLAKSQGFTVDDASLSLHPGGPNAVGLEVKIKARKAFLKGEFRVLGTAEVDRSFDIHLRSLKCEGIGPIGAMAARAIQPRLDQFSSTPIRAFGSLLSGFALDQMELKHGADQTIEIEARIWS
jgi:hypothetical protein